MAAPAASASVAGRLYLKRRIVNVLALARLMLLNLARKEGNR